MRPASRHLVVWRLESAVIRPTEAPDAPKPTPPAAVGLRVMRDTDTIWLRVTMFCGYYEAKAGSALRLAWCHLVVYVALGKRSPVRPTEALKAPKPTPANPVRLRVMTDAQSGPLTYVLHAVVPGVVGVQCGRRCAISLYGAWRAPSYTRPTRRMRQTHASRHSVRQTE